MTTERHRIPSTLPRKRAYAAVGMQDSEFICDLLPFYVRNHKHAANRLNQKVLNTAVIVEIYNGNILEDLVGVAFRYAAVHNSEELDEPGCRYTVKSLRSSRGLTARIRIQNTFLFSFGDRLRDGQFPAQNEWRIALLDIEKSIY